MRTAAPESGPTRYGQAVRRWERWPWLLTAGLMVASAAAVVGSTYLHWLPCRGSMVNGSIVRGYTYGTDFSDACLRRMDTGIAFPYPPEPAEQAPWASELGMAAMVLAGLAWLTLVLGQRWLRRTTSVAALPAVATLIVALVGAVALRDPARSPDAFLSWPVWLTIEGSALLAMVVIWIWQPEVRGPHALGLLLALWGTTAFGAFHAIAEYLTMTMLSDANWDTPPGTGYLTAGVLLVSAGLIAVMTLRSPPTSAAAAGHPSLQSAV